jgi:hypothetical protein
MRRTGSRPCCGRRSETEELPADFGYLLAYPGHAHHRTLQPSQPEMTLDLGFCWSRLSCVPSGHRKRVSQDIGNRAGPVRLTGDESQTDHHSGCHRGSYPGRGRRRVRRLEGLGQQAGDPLPGRGGGSVRATVSAPRQKPNRASRGHRATDHRAAREAHRRGPGRRTRHHRLAPDPAPHPGGVGVHHQPLPDPGRPGHRPAEEAPEILLHPVPSRAAEPDLAVRLHPLPAHPPRRHPGC